MKNTLETRLGIFFALALIAAILILELIGGSDFFKRGFTVRARFNSVLELKEGDAVKMAGVQIGRVESIALAENKVEVTMKLTRRDQVRTDSRAAIKFVGLLGHNYVAVEFGSTNAPLATEGTLLESSELVDLSTIMVKLDSVASGVDNITKSFSGDTIQNLLGPFTDFLKENRPKLSAALDNLTNITSRIAKGEGSVGKLIYEDTLHSSTLNTLNNFNRTADDLRTTIAETRSLLSQISAGTGTVGKLVRDETLYRETTTAMTNLREIFQKINQGQGSAGKLVNDESLFKNVKMTLQKVEKATEGLEDQGPLSVLGIMVNSLF
jgi:phospholipid/cholesterol/gamma-HCH transport system substrate-binding protein